MVSTPRLPVVLAAVCVALAIFQVTQAAISCTDCSGKDCAGSAWRKLDKKKEKNCASNETMCVSVFNKDAKVLLRDCLHPTLDIFFKSKVCIEKVPEIKEKYSDGVFACACNKENYCNIGIGGASGIEFKIGLLIGTPLILLVVNYFT